GHLILGGRDARSNDQLVKKHLKEGDRYAHADVHGAPSTVVKEGSRAGEGTLREACEFALAYSKAWSAGLAGGSAYWVLPEQVSKQAESGEYLPRGAFVIRGKRNYLHDLPLRIAIGEVEIEGHRKVMAGPLSAVVARSTRYVILEPGREDRERLARRLAAALEVPIEEVARLLPAGGLRVAEAVGLALDAGSPASG
ncbi:MAG: NFACT RNA binding domain-containing protein, partial [Methanobacteriota archaeon]